jgi:hypothetical protein
MSVRICEVNFGNLHETSPQADSLWSAVPVSRTAETLDTRRRDSGYGSRLGDECHAQGAANACCCITNVVQATGLGIEQIAIATVQARHDED